MPLGELQGAADRAAALAAALGPDAVTALGAGASGGAGGPDREELLARGLLAWFKTSFFTWVRAGRGRQARCAAGAGVWVARHVSRRSSGHKPLEVLHQERNINTHWKRVLSCLQRAQAGLLVHMPACWV